MSLPAVQGKHTSALVKRHSMTISDIKSMPCGCDLDKNGRI